MGELSSIFAAATSAGGLVVIGLGYWLAGPRQLKPTNTEAKVITARRFPNILTVQKFAVKNESALYLKFGASDVTKVPLKVFNVKVEKNAQHSLVLHDKMKVNADVMFQVSIDDTNEAVIKAAEALNGEFTDENVKQVAEARFDNALRLAAANMVMEEINSNRAKFIEGVRAHLKLEDLGLKLNEVSVQTLNPALLKDYDENNSFDAVGKQLATQIVETSKKTRNEIEQLAATQIATTNKDQALSRFKIEQEQTQAELAKNEQIAQATAEQARRVAEIQAKNQKEARLASIQAEQETAARDIQKTQQLELAEVIRQQAVSLATQETTKLTRAAEIATQTSVETADRDKEIALARKAAEAADAEALANEAKAKAVVAQQAVTTASAVAEAERNKRLEVIQAEAEAGKTAASKRIESETAVTVAENNARAAKTAAQGKADAARIEAEGEAEAVKLAAGAEYEHTFKQAKAVADGKMLDAAAVRALNEAHNVMSQHVRDYQLASQRIAVSPQLVEALTASIAKIDSFSVVSMDGVGYPGAGGSATGSTPGTGGNVIDQAYDKLLRHSFDKTVIAKVVGALGGDARIADALPSIASVLNDAASATAPAAVVPAPEQVAAPEQNTGPEIRTPRAPRPAAPGEAA